MLDDDDQLESKQCQYTSAQASVKHGATTPTFVYTLFDLQMDPYEHNNLYDVGTVEIEAIKAELYKDLAAVHAIATHDHSEGEITLFMRIDTLSYMLSSHIVLLT